MSSDRIITLAGLALSLAADSDDNRRCLDSFFGEAAPPSRGPADLHVNVRTASVSADLGVRGDPARQGPTQRWDTGTTLMLRHDLGAVAFVTGHELDIVVPPEADDPSRAIRHLLFSGLSWWLERRDLVLLHGAMIARGGEGALVLGATGSGKSTAAFAAQQSGWDLCSDDLVIIGIVDGQLQGVGVPKRPSLERAIAEGLGELEALHGDERARVMLDACGLATGWKRVRMLFVVDHDNGEGAVRPLGHADTLDAVFGASLETERASVVVRQFRTLMLLAGLPSFELLHAVERRDRLSRAAELIDDAWAARVLRQ